MAGDEHNETQVQYFSLVMLFSWICLLEYLRIFSEFRYLSELIVACLNSVKGFIAVVFIQILGFTFALYWRHQILEEEDDDSNFIQNFSSIFMNAFGDFSLQQEEMVFIDGFIMYGATLLICLVMMNLFIGILGEKLEEVIENRAEKKNVYAEKCMVVF